MHWALCFLVLFSSVVSPVGDQVVDALALV